MPAIHARVKELFLAVLEMPAAERAAYLDTACSVTDTPPGKTGTLARFDGKNWFTLKKVDREIVPADTWFIQEVIADGDHLVVKINGQIVADVVDGKHKRGQLALEALGPDTVVQFRKVEIRELPPGRATQKTSAFTLTLSACVRNHSAPF